MELRLVPGALGIRSSVGISIRPDLALKNMLSLFLALRSARAGQPKVERFLAELPWVKSKDPVTNRPLSSVLFQVLNMVELMGVPNAASIF